MVINKPLHIAIAALIIMALAVIYYQFNPANHSFFPECPFHLLTGLNCPGCGSQRAFYFLLHGNIAGAVKENVLFVIAVPFLLIHFFYKIKSMVLQKDYRWGIIYHPLTPKVIFVIVMVFWTARNIPVHPFNYLSAGR